MKGKTSLTMRKSSGKKQKMKVLSFGLFAALVTLFVIGVSIGTLRVHRSLDDLLPMSVTRSTTTQVTGPKVWIVSAENRGLSPVGTPMNKASYLDLMAVLNFHYAQTHGYGYTRFLYDDDAKQGPSKICRHPTYGMRHAAWCKLLAIEKIQQEAPDSVEYVVWLDADAMIQKQQLTIPQMIDAIPNGCTRDKTGGGCNKMDCIEFRRQSELAVPANEPFCGEPGLTAILFWKRKTSSDLRKAWWNSNRCANEHPYEQRAFSRDVYAQFRKNIAILNAHLNFPERPESELSQLMIRHIGSYFPHAHGRFNQSLLVAQYVGLTAERFSKLHSQLIESHLAPLSLSEMDRLSADISYSNLSYNGTALDCEYVAVPPAPAA